MVLVGFRSFHVLVTTVCRTFVELNLVRNTVRRLHQSCQCRSKVELIQLGSAHEKYGVWTRPKPFQLQLHASIFTTSVNARLCGDHNTKKKHKQNVLSWSRAPMSSRVFSNHFVVGSLKFALGIYTYCFCIGNLSFCGTPSYAFCLIYSWINTIYFPWNISSMLLCVYQRKGAFFYFYEHANTFDCCLVTNHIAPHSADRGRVKCHWNKEINNSSAILETIDKQCWTPSIILICSCCEFERGSSRSTYILFEKIARTGQWRTFAFLKVSPKLDNDQC